MKLLPFLFLLLSACMTQKQSGESLPDYNPKLAKELVETKQALLLDVRTEEEYNEAHIDGSTRIEISELPEKIEEVKSKVGNDLEKPIVVFCQKGGRAAKAKELLLKAGFKNVTNMGSYKDYPQSN